MRALIVPSLLLLGGCAQSLVAVLSPEDGAEGGGIEILDPTSQEALATLGPNTQAGLRGAITTKPLNLENDEIKALLGVVPRPPVRFTVMFRDGTTELNDPSALDVLVDLVKSRAGAEIVIVGHTNSVGNSEYNDRLSLKRAEAIKDLLVAKGFSADIIQTVGRGERELQVVTVDEVAEPLNSRVEIIVR